MGFAAGIRHGDPSATRNLETRAATRVVVVGALVVMAITFLWRRRKTGSRDVALMLPADICFPC